MEKFWLQHISVQKHYICFFSASVLDLLLPVITDCDILPLRSVSERTHDVYRNYQVLCALFYRVMTSTWRQHCNSLHLK